MTDVPCSSSSLPVGSSVGCMSHGRASRCAAADHKVKRAMRRSPSCSPILPCGGAVPLRYGTATQRSRSDEGPQRTNVIPDAPWGRVTGRGGTPAIPWMWRGGPPYNYAVHVNTELSRRDQPASHTTFLVQASRRKVVLVDAHRLLLQGRVDGLRSRASRRCRCRAGHSSCARAAATPPSSRDGALTAERWAVRSVGQASRRGPMA